MHGVDAQVAYLCHFRLKGGCNSACFARDGIVVVAVDLTVAHTALEPAPPCKEGVAGLADEQAHRATKAVRELGTDGRIRPGPAGSRYLDG